MHRRIWYDPTKLVHLPQTAFQLIPDLPHFPLRPVTRRRFTESRLFVLQAYGGKLFLCQHTERRSKHRGQGNVLLPVIQYLQIIQQYADLLRSEIPLSGARIRRNPLTV